MVVAEIVAPAGLPYAPTPDDIAAMDWTEA